MVRVGWVRTHPNAKMPTYATDGASGFDLYAVDNYQVYPGETVLVHTGLVANLPNGYEIQIRPRSGLSLKTPLRVSNAPGTIDSDYRGEISVMLTNTSNHTRKYTQEYVNGAVTIKRGDRVAQGVLAPVVRGDFYEEFNVEDTARGSGGFGSTGT